MIRGILFTNEEAFYFPIKLLSAKFLPKLSCKKSHSFKMQL